MTTLPGPHILKPTFPGSGYDIAMTSLYPPEPFDPSKRHDDGRFCYNSKVMALLSKKRKLNTKLEQLEQEIKVELAKAQEEGLASSGKWYYMENYPQTPSRKQMARMKQVPPPVTMEHLIQVATTSIPLGLSV